MGTGRFSDPEIRKGNISSVARGILTQLSNLGMGPAEITRWCERAVEYLKKVEEDTLEGDEEGAELELGRAKLRIGLGPRELGWALPPCILCPLGIWV